MEESLVPTPLLPGPVAPEVREEVPIDRSAGEYLDPLGRVRGTEVERLCRGPHQQGGRGHKVARVRPGGTDAPLDLQGNRLCNPIERRFVDYWVRTGDPLKAVQFAGYLAHSRSKQSLHKQIYHKMRTLRSRAHVMAYYRQRLDRLSARFSTTTAAIIGRHVVRAQATILDCLVPKEDGSGYEVAADLSRLTPQQAATIKKLRHEERVTQEGDTVHTTVVELHDAHAADVELGKIFGVYERRGPEEQVAGPVRLPATVADADRMIAEIQEHKNRLLALAEQAQRMTPVFAGRGILEAQVTGERPA